MVALGILLAALGGGPAALAGSVDPDVIRLASPGLPADREPAAAPAETPFGGARRGFDYEAFQARLEALWFQRKALLAEGRDADAARQAELIRTFCVEEGVDRLEGLSGALLAEAERFLREGHYSQALSSIELAESFDPGNPQLRMARAAAHWKSGRDYLRAAGEVPPALWGILANSFSDLSLFNHLTVVFVVAVAGCVALFSVLIVARHHVPLRHEVEEWLARRGLAQWGLAAGYGVLLVPFLLWFAAGWAALYWIVITFRFMQRSERVTALLLLMAVALAVPSYQLAVALYGVAGDPVVRNTLASADGAYEPNRIVELQQLVDNHPDAPIYRFLLAGLYKNGRYFEEAYAQYRRVLELDPAMVEAMINMGNIFQRHGQHAEAVNHYKRALELRPDSVLAYYNLHLAQSELFHFEEAEQSLNRALQLDRDEARRVLAASRAEDAGRPMVVDATIELGSIWQAALEGRQRGRGMDPGPSTLAAVTLARQLLNPVTLAACCSIAACALIAVASGGRAPARRCIRCGRPFCNRCRTGRQGQEYCSQCLHLFVLGDGLAPETKTRKLYEVDRFERMGRWARRFVSVWLPGSAQVLRGRATVGCTLLMVWLVALLAWQPAWALPVERLGGLDLRLDRLEVGRSPSVFNLSALDVLAVPAATIAWSAANLSRRRRES